MKINITSEELDTLIEQIDNTPLPEDYNFPSLEDAEELLVDLPGVTLVLYAAEKTRDKEYAKALNALIREKVNITEESENEDIDFDLDLSNLNKRVDQIKSKIQLMNFHIPYFCPSKAEIDKIAEKDLSKDDVALGFLIWVATQDETGNAPENVRQISRYAKKVLESAQKYA